MTYTKAQVEAAAHVADDDFDYGCTYRMLEAAALLREGWLPGDPLVRL